MNPQGFQAWVTLSWAYIWWKRNSLGLTPPPRNTPQPLTSTTLTRNRAEINRHQPVGTSCKAFYLLPFNFVLALILFPPSLLSFSHFTPSCSSILWGKIKKKLISPGQLTDWWIQLPYYLDNIMTIFPPATPHMPAPLWLFIFFFFLAKRCWKVLVILR